MANGEESEGNMKFKDKYKMNGEVPIPMQISEDAFAIGEMIQCLIDELIMARKSNGR